MLTQNYQIDNYPNYQYAFTTLAIGGNNSWSNLVRLPSVATTHAIVMDHANDADSAKDKGSLEAFIRRVWSENPATRITLIQSPSWNGVDIDVNANVTNPQNEATIGNVAALAAYYSIPLVGYWDWCKSVVPGTYRLNQLTDDTVHPSTLGYTNMAALVEAYLPDGGAVMPDPLPARLYDCEDFEHTPVVRDGTDYDARSGAGWTDDGTAVASSTAGNTITWSFTGRTFGCYRSDTATYPAVELSIDGGAFFSASAFYHGGYDCGTRAAHTVIVRVLTSVRIEEFWTI